MQTVTIGRTTYTVKGTDAETIPYELIGSRGASYFLIRSMPDGLLRGVNMKSRHSGVLGPFTDHDGPLRAINGFEDFLDSRRAIADAAYAKAKDASR